MPEQTTVTKPPVSESGEPQSQSPSGQGNSSVNEKEIENRVRENLRAEYDRKSEAMAEKVAELEEIVNKTKSEKEALSNLKDNQAEIDRQRRILRTNPEFQGYVAEIDAVGKKAASDAERGILYSLAKDYVGECAQKEGIEYDVLYKEINKILSDDRYSTKNALEAAKLAMRDRAEKKEHAAIREENKKMKAEKDGFVEGGQRQTREPTLQEAIDKGDTIGQAKALGL